jgi:hypothetical protein
VSGREKENEMTVSECRAGLQGFAGDWADKRGPMSFFPRFFIIITTITSLFPSFFYYSLVFIALF